MVPGWLFFILTTSLGALLVFADPTFIDQPPSIDDEDDTVVIERKLKRIQIYNYKLVRTTINLFFSYFSLKDNFCLWIVMSLSFGFDFGIVVYEIVSFINCHE